MSLDRTRRHQLVPLALGLSVFLGSHLAAAEPGFADEGSDSATPSLDDHERWKRRERAKWRPVSVTLNPLSLMWFFRLGVNVEFAIAPHHFLLVNPFYGAGGGGEISLMGRHYGGELAYRFYSRSTGAHGGFVGPFVGWMRIGGAPCIDGCGSSSDLHSVVTFGVDAGYQWIVPGGFTVGVGGGLARWPRFNREEQSSLIPRALTTVGYSF
jgi:hypothetical protein